MAERIPKQVIHHLSAVPLFSTCNNNELRAIARLGTSLNMADGTVFTRQGRPGAEFFLILDGNVRCLVDEKEVAKLGTGDFFGEMALLDSGPRNATVSADGPVRVLVLDAREFGSLIASSPAIAQKVLKAVAFRARVNSNYRD